MGELRAQTEDEHEGVFSKGGVEFAIVQAVNKEEDPFADGWAQAIGKTGSDIAFGGQGVHHEFGRDAPPPTTSPPTSPLSSSATAALSCAENPGDPLLECIAWICIGIGDEVGTPFENLSDCGFHDASEKAGFIAEIILDGGDVALGTGGDVAGGGIVKTTVGEDGTRSGDDGSAAVFSIRPWCGAGLCG